ncbi:MAG: hypothetical protein K0U74_16725 [Alphaproteobacteria bacterium]|nr:hypothetical protein [Alphaproteobacteria bacterium]
MALLYDFIAIFTWPFKLAYWTLILLVRALVWIAKGTLNLIVGVGLPALRFLAFVFLLVATIALVSDATPAVDGFGPFDPTLFVDHWRSIAPKSVTDARDAVSSATHPFVWNVLIGSIINLPTFLIFGALGALAALTGRRREKLDVFVN